MPSTLAPDHPAPRARRSLRHASASASAGPHAAQHPLEPSGRWPVSGVTLSEVLLAWLLTLGGVSGVRLAAWAVLALDAWTRGEAPPAWPGLWPPG